MTIRRISFVASFVWLAACGSSAPSDGVITTIAGTGIASFDADGLPAKDCGLYAPVQVVRDRSGLPLIVDWNNHRVRRLEADQTLMTVLGTGVEMIGPANNFASQFPIHHPFHFQLTPNGRLYFAGYHDPRVFYVDENDFVRVVAGIGTGGDFGDGGLAELAAFFAPSGVAVAADGTVYISDEQTHRVRRVGSDQKIYAFAGTSVAGYEGDGGPAVDAKMNSPSRMAIDGEGSLIVCDTKNHVLRKIDSNGIITTIAGTGRSGFSGDGGPANLAELSEPIDVKILDDGSMLIADSANHVIRRIDPQGIIETIAGTPRQAGFAGDGGPAVAAQFNLPLGVDIDQEGNLWISDTYNHRVRKITYSSRK